MGLPDTYDVLWQCDRWLLLGASRKVPDQLYKAIEEQQWEHQAFLAELLFRWSEWANRQAQLEESAAFNRGYGWRVWYPVGTAMDSIHHNWVGLPDGIMGGVVYMGPIRRILAGRDPFYLEHGLPRIRPSGGLPNNRPYESLHAKEGVWVTDQQMSDYRKQAVFAFGLEE